MPFALVSAAMVSRQPLSLYTHPVCIGHEPGMLRLGGNPESPARLSGLLHAMRTEWKPTLGEHLRIHDALEADATREQLLRVHSEAHLDKVAGAFANAERFRFPQGLDGDTVASPGSRAAATRAAGLVVAAAMKGGRGGIGNVPACLWYVVRYPGRLSNTVAAGF